jgi:Tfp pilus assembly protein PilF
LLFVKRISKNALLIRGNEITLKDMEPVTAPSIPVKIKAPAEDRARGEESANHVRMGTLYSLLELPNLAMHEYAKALEMDPSRALTYFKIALLLDDEGRQDRAREYVQKSLELDPGLVNAHVLLAMMKEDVEPEVAKDHYLKALEAFPHYGPVHKRLAEIYLDQGDFKNALRQINSARSDRYYEQPPDLDLCEARALIGLQKWKRAREVLEGYLIKRPHDTAALEMMKQVEKALNI